MKYVYCSASNSSVGCTEEILAAADLRVYLPLRGFADSLNLSVAAALVMHELFRLCPEAIGAMDEAERASLREDWFSRLAAQRIRTPDEAARGEGEEARADEGEAQAEQEHAAHAGGGGADGGAEGGGGEVEGGGGGRDGARVGCVFRVRYIFHPPGRFNV